MDSSSRRHVSDPPVEAMWAAIFDMADADQTVIVYRDDEVVELPARTFIAESYPGGVK